MGALTMLTQQADYSAFDAMVAEGELRAAYA